ncbi:TIM barrel protein [bacterium]|nr:TIM barrel protein [bacterium]
MKQSAMFGPAGFPTSFFDTKKYKKNRVNAAEWLHDIGLDILELQMVHGPRTRPEVAEQHREKAEEFGVNFSIHASYYCVLSSVKDDVVERSFASLAKTAELAALAGASRIVLHPGTTAGGRENALGRFITNMQKFVANDLPDGVHIYPETAGKVNSLGSLDEILTICREVPSCRPCVDFGHLHCRQLSELETDNGWTFTKPEDYIVAMDHLKANLRPEQWEEMHYHISPIEFTPKGEKKHRDHGELISEEDADPMFGKPGDPWLPVAEHFARALALTGYPAWVISEAADSMDRGALAMKKTYLSTTEDTE